MLLRSMVEFDFTFYTLREETRKKHKWSPRGVLANHSCYFINCSLAIHSPLALGSCVQMR